MIFLVRSKPDFHDKGMLKHGLLNFQSCRGSSRLLWDMAAMMPQRLRLISYASWSANKQKGTSADSRRVYTEKLAEKLDEKQLRSSRASQSSLLLCVAMCGKCRSQWKNIQDTDACWLSVVKFARLVWWGSTWTCWSWYDYDLYIHRNEIFDDLMLCI